MTQLWRSRLAVDAVPVVLGRFELDHVLGRGSHGVVFAAHDRALGRDVALKVFGSQSAHAALHEAQVLARVQHPNVVVLHDVGQSGGFHYLVLALIDGGTLSDCIRTGLDWRTAVELFVQVGRGLAAAHDACVVHGDVKPGNMLVGRDGHAYLADFGSAQSIVPGEPTITRGTPEYAAPESSGGGERGPWSDQFSFCVGLWEALFGERPTDGAKPRAHSDVPAQLRQVLRRGLSTKPRDRYSDVTELLHRLADLDCPPPRPTR
ncbi:MAG: serine/threonine-protein kinase [Enhygromyxa sp.]